DRRDLASQDALTHLVQNPGSAAPARQASKLDRLSGERSTRCRSVDQFALLDQNTIREVNTGVSVRRDHRSDGLARQTHVIRDREWDMLAPAVARQESSAAWRGR